MFANNSARNSQQAFLSFLDQDQASQHQSFSFTNPSLANQDHDRKHWLHHEHQPYESLSSASCPDPLPAPTFSSATFHLYAVNWITLLEQLRNRTLSRTAVCHTALQTVTPQLRAGKKLMDTGGNQVSTVTQEEKWKFSKGIIQILDYTRHHQVLIKYL